MPDGRGIPSDVDPRTLGLLADGVAEDWVDRRDRFFAAPLSVLRARLDPHRSAFPDAAGGRPAFGLRDQGRSGRCVGHALAAVIDIQRHIRAGEGAPPEGTVSADMLYHMARFHDRYTARPDGRHGLEVGGPSREGVRTLRAAIKGFYHHGACLDHPGAEPCPPDRWRSLCYGPPPAEGEPRLLSAAQAQAARGLGLGAYYRLRPVLHDYHAALHGAGAILVSARITPSWYRPVGDRIAWSEGAVAGEGHHAFVLVGYDAEGFVVLNSWGEGWGGFEGRPGTAHWSYHDWGANVVDAWVLRLGVPTPTAFEMTVGEHGPSRTYGPTRAGSVPCQELVGHYLHLDDGRHVEIDAYPSEPEMTAAMLRHLDGRAAEARAGGPPHRGVVLWLPGSLEPMKQGFELAVARRAWFEALGLHPVTVFWCNDFAQHVTRVLGEIIADCEAEAGAGAAHLDAMIEARAHGLGRALWREIEGAARRGVAAEDGGEGPVLEVVHTLFEQARRDGTELHVVAESAGVLVLDALLRARPWVTAERRAALAAALTSLALSLPAVELVSGEGGPPRCLRLLDLMRRMNRGSRRAGPTRLGGGGAPAPRLAARLLARERPPARVYLPDEALERRIRFGGYGRSVLHLVATSFMGTFDVRVRGPAPTLLGMADAAAPLARRPEVARLTAGATLPPGPIEQMALSLHPDLEAELLAAIRDRLRSSTAP